MDSNPHLPLYRAAQTTFLLEFPVWWAYLASFSASLVICIVAVYCAGVRLGECVTGRPLMPQA